MLNKTFYEEVNTNVATNSLQRFWTGFIFVCLMPVWNKISFSWLHNDVHNIAKFPLVFPLTIDNSVRFAVYGPLSFLRCCKSRAVCGMTDPIQHGETKRVSSLPVCSMNHQVFVVRFLLPTINRTQQFLTSGPATRLLSFCCCFFLVIFWNATLLILILLNYFKQKVESWERALMRFYTRVCSQNLNRWFKVF